MDICGKRTLRQRQESRNASRDKVNAIEQSAASHVPEGAERPLMIPQDHDPYDVWHHILDKFTDPKEVWKLWNVCSFFREILSLKQKYIQTRLPQIFQIILDKRPWFLLNEEDVGPGNTLPLLHSVNPSRQTLLNLRLMLEDEQNHFSESDKKKLKKTYLTFRSISKACKNSVEELLQGEEYLLALRTTEQVWNMIDWILEKEIVISTLFPQNVKVIEGRRRLENGFAEAVGGFLDLAGNSVKTFSYRSVDTAQHAYVKLCEWVLHMPNLEKLQLVPLNGRWPQTANVVEPQVFPHCPRLISVTQYWDKLPKDYVQSILEGNPQISSISLPRYRNFLREFPDPCELNSSLPQLESLHTPLYTSLLSYLDFRLPLKEILFHELGFYRNPPKISSGELFPFLNQFRDSLEHLELDRMDVEITDNCFLDLPHLKVLFLRTGTFKDLRFLVHSESLEEINIVVYWQNIENIIDLPSFSDGFFMKVTNGFGGLSLWDVFPRLQKLLLMERSVHKQGTSTITTTAIWNMLRS